MGLIWYIVIGALAGWLANSLMKRGEKGFFKNMLLGIVGGVLGGHLLDLIGISTKSNFAGSLFTSLVGAVILVWIVDRIRS